MFVQLLTCTAAILLLYILVQRKKLLNKLALYNGPKGWPFIGNALDVIHLEEALNVAMEWSRIHGRTFKIFLGFRPLLITTDTKLIESVLSSNTMIEKSIEYKIMGSWLGDGLITSTGEKWRKKKKLFSQSFNYTILENFIEIFNAKGTKLIENLGKQVGKESVDLCEFLGLYALDVICETAMGTCVNAQSNPESEYVKSIEELGKIAYERCMNPLLQVQPIYKFTSTYRREVKAVEVVHGFAKAVIKNRKMILEQQSDSSTKDDNMGIRKKSNFVDILLQTTIDGVSLSEESILEEVKSFMFAGHDTNSITLSSVLYYMSINPDIQERVVEELNDIFQGDRQKYPTYKEFQDMKYLEMVIKETLRLCPPATIIGRKTTDDIKYNGTTLPVGLSLGICLHALHRDPENFPDPEKFDPERFSLENQLGRSPYAYMPFSAGPRNCIGQKFAMFELKSCLSNVLRNFKILPVDGFKPKFVCLVTLKPLHGLKVRIEHRI